MLTNKHCPLASHVTNTLVSKHTQALEKIASSAMSGFGEGWLSRHKRKLGELTNEGKLRQTNDHHQANMKFRLTEMSMKINGENHLMLRKLVDISIGRKGNIMNRNEPRMTIRSSKRNSIQPNTIQRRLLSDWKDTPPTATAQPHATDRDRKVPRSRRQSDTGNMTGGEKLPPSNQDIHAVVTTIPTALEDTITHSKSPEGSIEEMHRKESKTEADFMEKKDKKIKSSKLRNRKHSMTLKNNESFK